MASELDRYELVKDLGVGNFGIARLMMDRQSGELVAIKFIERGEKVRHTATGAACEGSAETGSFDASQVDKNVEREILNHRMLSHPNIVGFKEVGRMIQ